MMTTVIFTHDEIKKQTKKNSFLHKSWIYEFYNKFIRKLTLNEIFQLAVCNREKIQESIFKILNMSMKGVSSIREWQFLASGVVVCISAATRPVALRYIFLFLSTPYKTKKNEVDSLIKNAHFYSVSVYLIWNSVD